LSAAEQKAEKKAKDAIAADETFEKTSDGKFISAQTRMSETAWGEDDWKAWLRLKGTNPDDVTFKFGLTTKPGGEYWNKLYDVRYKDKNVDENGIPLWPVIEKPATVYNIRPVTKTPKPTKFKTAVVGADTQ